MYMNADLVWCVYVTQGLKTRRLSLPRFWARGPNRRQRFSSLQFFNSAGVREFAVSCKVLTRFLMPFVLIFYTE